MCIAPYSGAESGCHDVPLPSRSIGIATSVEPFIVIPDIGDGDAMFMPGIGAIVGLGDGFAAVGAGVVFFAGAAVAMGIPGMGAIVGCAATAGAAARETKKAAMPRRVTSKGRTSSEY